MVGKYHSDRVQAHYLALAGIEKAKALLYQDSLERSRAGVHHGAGLYDAPAQFRDILLGRGQFRIIRGGTADEGGGLIYGVSDEESRLNINVADVNQLTNIMGLRSDIAAAIVDWRDGDNAVSPGGAEEPYYASLQPPYLPRNAEFPTLRELLMVRGVTPELLNGEPQALLAAGLGLPAASSLEESTADEPEPPSNSGWSSLLTAHSSVEDVDASGSSRVNIQSADIAALTGVSGITTPIAQAIIAHRTRTRFESLADLLEVRAAPPGGQNRNNNNAPTGPTVIADRLFQDIADHLTVEDQTELRGAINLNTASVEVLMCLPGVTRPLAQAVVAHRKANGFFPHIAELLQVSGMNRELFKQVAPHVTVRSETFRILSEGRVGKRGSRQRIEVVVHVGLNSVKTLAYREDDL
ncbi:MAG TPA: type II secretion system protein GspK [Verrucomicrobiota bacterium]|nr:type II secretion system protein GspK [Verrucomicrobiota bacterium]